MPTYDYKCTKCDHGFELFQSMSEEPAKKCPECGGLVRRLVSGGKGLIFKGSGFYLTDYVKNKDTKKESKKNNGVEKKKTKSDSTKKNTPKSKTTEKK